MKPIRDSSLVRVLVNEDLGGGRFRLGVAASDIHLTCRPGQFFNIALPDGAPYLPRPFSIYEIFPGTDRLDFLIASVGSGTDKLSRCQPGDSLLLIGPLGRPFPLQKESPHHVFIAGSIGLAPFIELHRELKKLNSDSSHTLIYGARTHNELVDCKFLETLDWTVKTCTDDGSSGNKGRVTDILSDLNVPKESVFYTCGPNPMMKAVAAQLIPQNHKLWVSMEEHMACGIGICKGCVLYSPESPPPLSTVCKDGPIFEASSLYPELASVSP